MTVIVKRRAGNVHCEEEVRLSRATALWLLGTVGVLLLNAAVVIWYASRLSQTVEVHELRLGRAESVIRRVETDVTVLATRAGMMDVRQRGEP